MFDQAKTPAAGTAMSWCSSVGVVGLLVLALLGTGLAPVRAESLEGALIARARRSSSF